MKRISTLAAVLTAAAVAAGGASARVPTLKGTVTDAFKITLTRGGKRVKTLKPGTYRIVVRDPTSIHNFHLFGPHVNKKTSVAGKGTKTWVVRLRKGTYRYVCDPHKAIMKGSFRVT